MEVGQIYETIISEGYVPFDWPKTNPLVTDQGGRANLHRDQGKYALIQEGQRDLESRTLPDI
jgi:hypothetical protein